MAKPFPRFGAAIAAVVVAGGLAGAWIYAKRPQRAPAAAANSYVDAMVCADCHDAIAASFHKNGMGRSFARASADNVPAFSKTFHHKASDSEFEMIEREGKYYQRRWQTGFDGKETNVEEKQVDYVIGSGNHARTYLHLTPQNALQVLPLSWYSEKGGHWDMSPGYDQPDYPGSIRPVHYECMFCHNAYPKIPDALRREGSPEMIFAEPIPEGIDCQRCHGPGQRHVELASSGGTREQIRAAIVNPARLTPERELEVCMQCHLETTNIDLPHSIRRFDAGPFSYVPGQPLSAFSIEFDRPGGTNNRFEIAHGAYRFRESQCFIKSQGKLHCTTCHNPHDIPHGPEATAHYNSICEGCHAATLQASGGRAPHKKGADCVSCHMPKRRTDDVVHAVMTDHRIQRRKPEGDLLAPKPELVESETGRYVGEVVAYYPTPLPETAENSLYVGVAQVRYRRNLEKGLPLLAGLLERDHPAEAGFYAELAQGYRSAGEFAKSVPYFEEAAKREPTGYRLLQLGNAQMEARQLPQAEVTLRRAISLTPDDATAWGTLGWVLWQQDKGAEARTDLEKGVGLDPDLPELHNNLGSVEWGLGDQAAAEQQFREALRIEPGVAEWRLNLARVLATRGEAADAGFQFEQAIRLKPELADAHIDYAQLLQDRGDLRSAIRHLETAVRLQPDLARARFELGMALGRSGDQRRAVEQLKIAANGPDPNVRAQALDVLQKVGR